MALHTFTCRECQDLSQWRANDCVDCGGFGRITIDDEGALSGEIITKRTPWGFARGPQAEERQWSASCDGMIAYGSTLGIALDRLMNEARYRADQAQDIAEAA